MGLKVMFVIPDVRPNLYLHPGSVFEGVAYLSAVLRQRGHSCVRFQPTTAVSSEPLLEQIAHEQPDLIAYSAVTNMIKYIKRWAPDVQRRFPHIRSICGGVHATADPEDTLGIEGVNAVCRGEGEFALAELCDRIEKGRHYYDIPSLWFKTPNGIVRNPVGRLPPHLDDYPFPDLDLFQIENSFHYRNRLATMKLSRGCPMLCAYCCNTMFRTTYPSDYVRFRSPARSLEYIKTYLSRYPKIDAIAFLDDILSLDMKWFREFTTLYRKEVGLPYTARSLVNVFTPEAAELFAGSGCYEVTFGVESGSPQYRGKYLRRHQTDERIIAAFMLCKKHGMTTRANMMLGLPHETPVNLLEGIKLCSKLDAKYILAFTYFPTPATELHELCLRDGLISPDDEIPDDPYNTRTALRQQSVSPEQVEFVHSYYSALVQLYAAAPESLHRRIDQILLSPRLPRTFLSAAGKVLDALRKKWWRAMLWMNMPHGRFRPKVKLRRVGAPA